MKFKRNAMCWCGSGLKYKKCHLSRGNQDSIGKQAIHKQINSFYEKKMCSVPASHRNECTKRIVKAHSVSKSTSLKDIAKNGHVLTTFKTSANFNTEFQFKPKKIGINQASTFTGFCSFHDKSIFSPIEDKEFEISEHHCFLVAYRAIARESFVKERASGTLDMIKELDRGHDLATQINIQNAHKYFSNNNNLTSNDLAYIKSVYDQCFENEVYDMLSHIVFKLKSAPKVMTSAVVAPFFDFQGNRLQEITSDPETIPHYIGVNTFSSNGAGYIVLSCLKEHKDTTNKFVDSLTKNKSISDSFVAFLFATIENLYLSEVWWNNLDEKSKNELISLISVGINTPTFNDTYVTASEFSAFDVSEIIRVN